jgi:hypothetical protein
VSLSVTIAGPGAALTNAEYLLSSRRAASPSQGGMKGICRCKVVLALTKPTNRRNRPLPTNPAFARMEQGFARLVTQCAADLRSIGEDIRGLPPIQIVAMARAEKRRRNQA